MTEYRSKSETPKSQREPFAPATLRMPDPSDYFASAAYIDQRAAMGGFAGAPGGTVGVLHYLWRHTAINPLPGEIQGWVLSGKSSRAKIATENYLSLSAVDRALKWLEGNHWLWKLIDVKSGNDMTLKVLMDQEGHEARSGLTDQTLPSEGMEGTVSQTVPLPSDRQDNTSTSTSTPTTTSTSGKEAHQGKRGRKEAGHSLATTPGPTALGPTATASLAPRSARTYTFWESRDVPGKFFVFPEDKALRAPRSAARVTLSVEEEEFYQKSFRGGVEANESRAWFLSASVEDRRELMAQMPLEAPQEPAPEVRSIKAGDWYPAGKQTSQDRVPVWFSGSMKNRTVYFEKPLYDRNAQKVSIDRAEFNRLFGLAA